MPANTVISERDDGSKSIPITLDPTGTDIVLSGSATATLEPMTGIGTAPAADATDTVWGPAVSAGKTSNIDEGDGQAQYGMTVQCYKTLPKPYLDSQYVDVNRESICNGLAEPYAKAFASSAAAPLPSWSPDLDTKTDNAKMARFPGGFAWAYTGDGIGCPASDPKKWLHDVCMAAMPLFTKDTTDGSTHSNCIAPISQNTRRWAPARPRHELPRRAGDSTKTPIKGGKVQITIDGNAPAYEADRCVNCVVEIGLMADFNPQPNPTKSSAAPVQMPEASETNLVFVGDNGSGELEVDDSDIVKINTQNGDQELADQKKEEEEYANDDGDSCDIGGDDLDEELDAEHTGDSDDGMQPAPSQPEHDSAWQDIMNDFTVVGLDGKEVADPGPDFKSPVDPPQINIGGDDSSPTSSGGVVRQRFSLLCSAAFHLIVLENVLLSPFYSLIIPISSWAGRCRAAGLRAGPGAVGRRAAPASNM